MIWLAQLDELWVEAVRGVIASGPMAAVLLAALWIVWKKYQQALDDRIKDLENERDTYRNMPRGESTDGE